MLQVIINFFLKIFEFFRKNKQVGGFASDVFNKAASSVATQIESPKRVDLLPERIPQESLAPNPNKKYACNVAAHLMMDIAEGGAKMSLTEYYEKCLSVKAIRSDCFILDYNKMREVSGLKGYKYTSETISKNSIQTILNNLNKGITMHVHVGGHFEMIKGYEYFNGELLFLVNDPGYQVDTHIESTTWKMFKIKDGQRIYSKNSQKQERKALSIGWYVK
jgi:hypothetical protein